MGQNNQIIKVREESFAADVKLSGINLYINVPEHVRNWKK
jgi:hypothetical protein